MRAISPPLRELEARQRSAFSQRETSPQPSPTPLWVAEAAGEEGKL
jgi:hypothetical protein